jgi:hypothetical protein
VTAAFFKSNKDGAGQMQQLKVQPIAAQANRELGCFRSMITELWSPPAAEPATALQPSRAHKLWPRP